MTNEEIISMADKVGFETCRGDGWPDERLISKVKRFAALVAAAERKEILNFATSETFNRQYGERSPYAYELVAAILARGQA